jgi:hypothetical protein
MQTEKTGKEVKVGDRIWMYCGPVALIVGHILEQSPDGSHISVSPIPYDEFVKLPLMQRANIPVNWCPLKLCSYVAHIPHEELKNIDKEIESKRVSGFAGSPTGFLQ